MSPTSSNRAQRRQAIQEQLLRNRNLLGRSDAHPEPARHIL